jgi:hypothetical protein
MPDTITPAVVHEDGVYKLTVPTTEWRRHRDRTEDYASASLALAAELLPDAGPLAFQSVGHTGPTTVIRVKLSTITVTPGELADVPSSYYLGPLCGSCAGQLEDPAGEGGGTCNECLLVFTDDGEPEYMNPEDTPCGHHPHACTVTDNEEFTADHRGCSLPAGHTSDHHDACTYLPRARCFTFHLTTPASTTTAP